MIDKARTTPEAEAPEGVNRLMAGSPRKREEKMKDIEKIYGWIIDPKAYQIQMQSIETHNKNGCGFTRGYRCYVDIFETKEDALKVGSQARFISVSVNNENKLLTAREQGERR